MLSRAYRSFRSVVRFQRPSFDREGMRLQSAANIDDLRHLARRRLPRGVFDYIDGGAEDEVAMAHNRSSFGRHIFQPRVLTDVSEVSTETEIFGHKAAMPLILAPTGFTRMAHWEGELAVARAAGRAGVPYSISTMATSTIEDVAAVASGPVWFQVYTWKDRGLVAELIQRAAAAGYSGLWLTVDTAVLGRRERDVRRGFTIPPQIGLDTIVSGMLHPRWTWEFLNHDPIVFANVVGSGVADGTTPIDLATKVMEQFDPKLSWDDLEWVRSLWDGPLILKGIQTVSDAERAVSYGVEGVALSNHGGRQLDGAIAPIDLVEPVAQSLQGRATVIVDGGVRRGSDIVKAIALGADAVSIGRPYLYGLGAAGERGVAHALKFFQDGLHQTMALVGRTRIADIDRSVVTLRSSDS